MSDDDAGEYVCLASNSVGEARAVVVLQGKPYRSVFVKEMCFQSKMYIPIILSSSLFNSCQREVTPIPDLYHVNTGGGVGGK